MNRFVCAVVLAAGEGTRMRSARPKPLHQLCGRPMAGYVLDALAGVADCTIVVVGHGATWVEKELSARHGDAPSFVEQAEQLGTGHAVATALPTVGERVGASDGDVLIVPGDAPLLRASTLARLVEEHQGSGAALTVLSAHVSDPSGYGRVVRASDGSLERIVEERDASAQQRSLREVNTAVMAVRAGLLGPGLRRVGRQNAQHEYLLTDLVDVLRQAGHATRATPVDDPLEVAGVNDRAQLAAAEREMRRRINERWMQRGVTMWDPATTYVDADVQLGVDVSLLPGTVLRGACVIGSGVAIGPHAYVEESSIGDGAHVGSARVTRSRVGERARLGSFAVVGPGAVIEDGASVAPGEHHPG